MCQEDYSPVLVISIEGDREFMEIPVDLSNLEESGGGFKNTLAWVLESEGFNFDHIFEDLETEINFFIGLKCRDCGGTYPVGGMFSWKIPKKIGQDLALSEFEKEFGIRPSSYIQTEMALLTLKILEEYFCYVESESVSLFFHEDPQTDEEPMDGDAAQRDTDNNNPLYYRRN